MTWGSEQTGISALRSGESTHSHSATGEPFGTLALFGHDADRPDLAQPFLFSRLVRRV
jgi:hypothetical protein